MPEISPNLFTTYFLPISGIDFVRYIAIYSALADFNLKPDKIYCASGGCLASYIALMSSFTTNIENWKFNSDMIFKKIPITDPRVLTFVLNGYLYRRRNLTDHLKKTFIPHKCQDVEIITGFFDSVNDFQRINITTNFIQNNSILKNYDENNFTGGNLVITYAEQFSESKTNKENYDILLDYISDSIHKTTNIPFMIEPFGKNQATDFGIVAPSPRVILKADVTKSIYFAPIDIDNNDPKSQYVTLFHHFILKDILSIEEKFPLKIGQKSVKNNVNYLRTLKDALNFICNFCEEYCLVIYSKTSISIHITNFNESDVKNAVNHCKNTLSFKLFYKPKI